LHARRYNGIDNAERWWNIGGSKIINIYDKCLQVFVINVFLAWAAMDGGRRKKYVRIAECLCNQSTEVLCLCKQRCCRPSPRCPLCLPRLQVPLTHSPRIMRSLLVPSVNPITPIMEKPKRGHDGPKSAFCDYRFWVVMSSFRFLSAPTFSDF